MTIDTDMVPSGIRNNAERLAEWQASQARLAQMTPAERETLQRQVERQIAASVNPFGRGKRRGRA